MRISPEILRITGANRLPFAPPPLAKALAAANLPVDFRWLGHAGVSLAWAGRTIVFDPVITPKIGGIFRRALPVVSPHDTPDITLISHSHRDHFDAPSLLKLAPKVTILPRGTGKYLPKRPSESAIVEMRPGETVEIDGFRISAHAMKHPGWRHPLARSYPALGYTVTRAECSVFHAGDSAACLTFDEIGTASPPTLACIPIGAYSPRFVLRDKHLTPEEAVAAALKLQARLTIPIHFATFRLSFEPPDEPFPRFAREARRSGLPWCTPWAE